MNKVALTAVAVAVALAGCKTTEEAGKAVRGKWLDKPVDAFFVENGPPISSFPLEAGGTIYTWRGGETSYVRPAQFQTRPAQPAFGNTVTRTTTVNTGPGSSVTRSSTTSFGVGTAPTTTMVRPAQRVELVCEAQIATDKEGKILSVRISRDTDGAGFSLSRCAEVFAGD
jgi:hypothetical protein